jgi:transcriptional regulator with XRE-family HTH domain
MAAAADLIRGARREAGLTQVELAARLGRTQASVASLERSGANPTVATLDEALAASGFELRMSTAPRHSNVDETLVARNLRMSPAQRLKAFETAHREVAELRELMAASDGG